MKVYAVVPAYNEASRISGTVFGVQPYVDGVIVVDDGSSDATAVVARESDVTVLRHAINRGQGAALKTGTDAALRLGADVIVHVDADGQHDPSLISSLVQPIREGRADVVFGSRFLYEHGLRITFLASLGMTIPESDNYSTRQLSSRAERGTNYEYRNAVSHGMPLGRRALLRAARTFNSLVMGIPRRVTDPQSGMRAMSRDAALAIDFRQDRMAHCSEILRLVTRSQLRWLEIPISVRYSSDTLAKGQKSMDALRIAWHLFLGAFAR